MIRSHLQQRIDLLALDFPNVIVTALACYAPLAANVNTEKARSELVIANVLIEFMRMAPGHVALRSHSQFGRVFFSQPSVGRGA